MKALLNNNSIYLNHGLEVECLLVKQNSIIENLSSRHKVFSSADLWNIQRQTKYRAGRRFL